MPTVLREGIREALGEDGGIAADAVNSLKKLAAQHNRDDIVDLLDEFAEEYSPLGRRKKRHRSTYANRVVSVQQEPSGGASQTHGSLAAPNSLDALSIKRGASVVLELGISAKNGVKLFKDPFAVSTPGGKNESPKVEVSADGMHWYTMPEAASLKPVLLNSQYMVNPGSVSTGGDDFSFKNAGIPEGTSIRLVKITARGSNIDLDAVYGY